MVLVSGVSFLLSPDWNPIAAVQPFLKKQLLNERGGFSQIIINTLKKQLSMMIAIPAELQKVLQKLNKGKV